MEKIKQKKYLPVAEIEQSLKIPRKQLNGLEIYYNSSDNIYRRLRVY